ncbi:2-nitropropane dioxygenase precursor [Dendryphion nanum]|uniref:2-nitropropane dioxygenase n=1 Tax=Dendryphion nanum TaxID=256645 RepID=A0A9P9D086_9PLEO|nr:2-nitropropane dioxygenase precursor [Dendryphion nanum]
MNTLRTTFPWTKAPFLIAAPMRVMSGPHLALAVSRAGGLGFIGPGLKPSDTATDLATARDLLKTPLSPSPNNPQASKYFSPESQSLPIGVGFQLWNGDLSSAAAAVAQYKPVVAWLFAPRNGQTDLDEWTQRIRAVAPETQIWIQIGTVQESIAIAQSAHKPDVIVVQGEEAGGHGRANDGIGLVTLVPEIADQVRGLGMGIVAAGGIADGRGVAAALALGADGVAMGTRFLASTEARISGGYQGEVVRARDGAKSTRRTMLYNQLRGTVGWPEGYSPRGVVNRSWYDHEEGVEFGELKRRHDEALEKGDEGWGPEGRLATYAGAGVGLIHGVEDAGVLVERVRGEASEILKRLGGGS